MYFEDVNVMVYKRVLSKRIYLNEEKRLDIVKFELAGDQLFLTLDWI